MDSVKELRQSENGFSDRQVNINAAVGAMEPGQTLEFDIARWSYVRQVCSRFSVEDMKCFRTRSDRDRRVIQVYREK